MRGQVILWIHDTDTPISTAVGIALVIINDNVSLHQRSDIRFTVYVSIRCFLVFVASSVLNSKLY